MRAVFRIGRVGNQLTIVILLLKNLPSQVGLFRLLEERGGREIAFHQCFEAVEPHADLGRIRIILTSRRRSGADHVSEVIEGRAWHGGVEVDHTDALGSHVGQQDIFQLGVIVGDTLRYGSTGDKIRDARTIAGTSPSKGNFSGQLPCPPG